MTDPTADRRAAASPTPSSTGKPVLASWMGGADVAAGETILNQAGIPTFPLPRHRRPRLPLHVALHLQPARPLRDADLLRGEDDAGPDRAQAPRRSSTAHCAAGRTLLTEVESKQLLAAYGIPTVATPDRDDGGRGGAAAEAIGYPVVLKLLLGDDHAQDRRRRRAAEPARRRRGRAAPSARSRPSVREKAGAEHFQGVTVQPMVRARRLRADRRQQPRPAVRPGAAVRHRRPARRGLQGPRAGAAAAEHDAGAADDGADPRSSRRCKACAAARPVDLGGAGAAAGALQPAGRRAAAGSRRSTSTRCSPRPTACSRSTPAWCSHGPDMSRREAAPPGDPPVPGAVRSAPGR